MKLPFEKWVDETKPFKESDPAYEFFEESVRCYKIGAYKSAFIMSYLAFKTTIRNRILDCTYGKELVKRNPKFWEKEIIEKLEDEDTWENYLNTIVEASCADEDKKKDIAILNFTNGKQVKTAYTNWKDIRNACAHGKRNVTIDSSTVECFWNYLIDNLSGFYVLGGNKHLITELENIYKYYRYPEIVHPETVNSLMSDVNVICNNNSKEFFQTLFEKLIKIARGSELVNNSNHKFWKDILESSHENIKNGIVAVISNDPVHFINFYNYFPQLLQMSFSINQTFIINDLSVWLSESSDFEYDNRKTFWTILVNILDEYYKYKTHVTIDRIVNEKNIKLIESFEPDERSLKILNDNDVFNNYIFKVSSWFFQTDANSQHQNRDRLKSKEPEYIELCFNYLKWDKDCIEYLNRSLVILDSSMASRYNVGSKTNGYRYVSICKRIICNNNDKIRNVPDVNLGDYSEVSKILENCISAQDNTATLPALEQNE
ncbi:hypothetical protein P4H27_07445 [Paenibacillus taichungensis]|uniref:hypothetical protein n=1 Tax=Paenibacillus taichungensis TaxID=484184 RepID=UPI002DBB14BC|nr:hypothetical protein [Paenibacillus taichungensis]MEC0106771.1 hypothetical protein [Paenibacillus taichungensis]MEC0195299.1 hypothetical protein [Paenibacillus taichungensis]